MVIENRIASGIDVTTTTVNASCRGKANQQPGQGRRHQPFNHDGMHGVGNKYGLIKQERQRQALRKRHIGQALTDFTNDIESGRTAALETRDQRRFAAVMAHKTGLLVVTVPDVSDIVDVHHGAADAFHGNNPVR
jgi:hypothetical protein